MSRVEESQGDDQNDVFVVELPVAQHSRQDVIEAKKKEMRNLETYEVFDEVEDEGQEKVG